VGRGNVSADRRWGVSASDTVDHSNDESHKRLAIGASPNADPPLRRPADPILLQFLDHLQHSLRDFANLAWCQEREVEEFQEQ
jgi:hypothetical protein